MPLRQQFPLLALAGISQISTFPFPSLSLYLGLIFILVTLFRWQSWQAIPWSSFGALFLFFSSVRRPGCLWAWARQLHI